MTDSRRTAQRGLGIGASALLGLAVAGCILGGGALVLADPIATSIARDRLSAQGIECDERFAVTLGWTLADASIGPTTCTTSAGAIESFELLDPLTIELGEGFDAQAVRGGRARIATRFDPPVLQASGLGALLDALEIPGRLGMLVGGAAQLSGEELPRIEMTSIEVVRGGRATAVLSEVRLVGRSASAPMSARAERVDLPLVAGPLGARATIAIAPMSADATPSHVTLEGDLHVDAAVPILGAMQRDVHVRVVGDGLDGPSPHYAIEM